MAAVLITGFEPFGGFTHNPSAEVAGALDGLEIGGRRISSHILPVDFAKYRGAIETLLREVSPVIYLGFGLAAGESLIRIERFGVNLADFDLPDNTGARHAGLEIEPGGVFARMTTLPCTAIRTTLIDAGIPARISNSAGTYLCNAALYSALGLCETQAAVPLCGFIHLPYSTAQVAAMLQTNGSGDRRLDSESAAPSMSIEMMIEAAKIAIRVSLEQSAA